MEIYDEDKKGSHNLDHHDAQGEVNFTVAELMCGDNETITKSVLKDGKDTSQHGMLTVRAEEMASCSEHLRFQLAGSDLPEEKVCGVVGCEQRSS